MILPERARALAWHIARVLAGITAVLAVVAVGSLLLLAVAYALAGTTSWWVPVALVLGVGVAGGVVTWWRAGMRRP